MPPEGALYNRIAALRADRNLTRQNLADALGINYQTLGAIERGAYAPGLDLALRIAGHFQLPVEMVFSRTPFRPMSEELAQRLDVSRQTINAIETQRYEPSLSLALKIARLFNARVEEIFDDGSP